MKPKDPKKIQHIYACTIRLVNKHGLTGLNMAAIGKEAKLGMGTIYVYFSSKEDLINSLFRHLKTLNTARIYKGISLNEPFKSTLRQLFDNYVLNHAQYFHEHMFIEQCVGSHYLDKESQQLDEAAYDGLFALLNRGKAEELVKHIDNGLLAAHLVGSANEMVNFCMRRCIKVNNTLLKQAFSLCWDSLQR